MTQEMKAEMEQERELDDLEEAEEPDEDDDDLADPEEVEAELNRVSPGDDEDEDSDEASLEELLAQRSKRKVSEDADDTEDIMALASEREPKMKEPLPSRVIPMRDRQEFVCTRCHLVKARSQLADTDRLLCRDCV